MPEYRVRWEVDVDAEGPYEAAVEARRLQRDPEAQVGVFHATAGRLNEVTIDLDDEENPIQ